MKEYSVVMSLVDLIPVICFGYAAVVLQRALYYKMSKGAFALFSAGTIDVIAAGGLKALYKLLYALNICDFEKLNQMFFPVQSIGFLLAGIAVVAMFSHSQKDEVKALSVAPAVFSGTWIFVGCMIAGLACINGGLIRIASKLKKPGVVILYVVSFICCLSMGYLSTKDFDKAYMNWICEAINCLGQGAFLVAALILRKSGLEKFTIDNKH